VVNQIDFQTGGWDAEYGNKNAAVVNVTTRIPSGGFHLDASGYGGSFSANGQGVNLSTNAGKWGFFFSGARQSTTCGASRSCSTRSTTRSRTFTTTARISSVSARCSYVPTDRDVLNLDVDRSRTRFAVPFDSANGVIDDHQQDVNGFVNPAGATGRRGRIRRGRFIELFTGAFFRDGTLNYTPGLTDSADVQFPGDTNHYIISEDRNFRTVGVKLDYTLQPHHGLEFKTGVLASYTSGHEDFSSVTNNGTPGPSANSDLKGSDVGVYAQTAIAPSDHWSSGWARGSTTQRAFAGNRNQVSPARNSASSRTRPTRSGVLRPAVLPTNVEDLRAITSTAQGGVAAEPRFRSETTSTRWGTCTAFRFGVVTKLSAYHKRSSPGIDDATIPGPPF